MVGQASHASPNRKSFRKTLERAMFSELTETWQKMKKARHTFAYIPVWRPRKLSLTHVSTKAERILLRCSFAHNDSRTSRHFGSLNHNMLCRHCGAANETIEHLFLQCTSLDGERNELSRSISMPLDAPGKFLRTTLLNRNFSIPAQRFALSALPPL